MANLMFPLYIQLNVTLNDFWGKYIFYPSALKVPSNFSLFEKFPRMLYSEKKKYTIE